MSSTVLILLLHPLFLVDGWQPIVHILLVYLQEWVASWGGIWIIYMILPVIIVQRNYHRALRGEDL